MSTADDLRKRFYNESNYPEALEKIEAELNSSKHSKEEREDLYALKAWCHYKQRAFDDAYRAIQHAGRNQKGLECLLHLCIYDTPYKDKESAETLAAELGNTVNVSNAILVASRSPESDITAEEVLQHIEAHAMDEGKVANLYNNGARYFLAKGTTQEELLLALGLMEAAISLYGRGDKNVDHRAGAHYWKSIILEKLLDKKAARVAAEVSDELWQRQEALDPDNEGHRERRANVLRHLASLLGIVLLASGRYISRVTCQLFNIAA